MNMEYLMILLLCFALFLSIINSQNGTTYVSGSTPRQHNLPEHLLQNMSFNNFDSEAWRQYQTTIMTR